MELRRGYGGFSLDATWEVSGRYDVDLAFCGEKFGSGGWDWGLLFGLSVMCMYVWRGDSYDKAVRKEWESCEICSDHRKTS